MPYIDITVNEKVVNAKGTDTTINNVALVPLFYSSGIAGTRSPQIFTGSEATGKTFADLYESAVHCLYDSTSTVVNDPTYDFIKELLNVGMPILVHPIDLNAVETAQKTIDATYNYIPYFLANTSFYNDYVENANQWNIKFITSGAWPNLLVTNKVTEGTTTTYTVNNAIISAMSTAADDRGDCIALINFQDEYEYFKAVQSATDNVFGATKTDVAFWPNNKSDHRPGSFYYLQKHTYNLLGKAGNVIPDWHATAGANKGTITDMTPSYNVSEAEMHALQRDGKAASGSITINYTTNPIMYWNFDPQGVDSTLVIFGNRTATADDTSTTDADSYFKYLNVRMMISDIIKQVKKIGIQNTFEPNDDITWINFKAGVNSLLDEMKDGRGLEWYTWKREQAAKLSQIKATLFLKPIVALESIELTITLTDDDTLADQSEVTVTETV